MSNRAGHQLCWRWTPTTGQEDKSPLTVCWHYQRACFVVQQRGSIPQRVRWGQRERPEKSTKTTWPLWSVFSMVKQICLSAKSHRGGSGNREIGFQPCLESCSLCGSWGLTPLDVFSMHRGLGNTFQLKLAFTLKSCFTSLI